MAVVLMEGWDNLPTTTAIQTKGWTAIASGASFVTGRYPAPPNAAASKAYHLSLASGSAETRKTLPSTYTTLIVGTAFNFDGSFPGLTSGRGPIGFYTSANAIVGCVTLSAGGQLQVTNSSSTVIATGTKVLNPATWYYIEFKLVVNGASGTCEVHLDGATEIASTVGNFGSTGINIVGFDCNAGAAFAIDDTYCADTTGSAPQNTFLGPSRIITPMPDAAGTHSQWTANGTTPNFACVNEVPPDDDTTYVSDSTPGDLDSYVFGQADGGATIFCVQTNHYARKDDANTRQIAPLIRQAGTDFIGNTFTEAASYTCFTQLWNQDPTGTNWTPAVFNADEFGVKEIA